MREQLPQWMDQWLGVIVPAGQVLLVLVVAFVLRRLARLLIDGLVTRYGLPPTFGFAAHTLLRHATAGLVEPFRAIRARFSRHVFPGETLVVEIWDEGAGYVRFRCRVLERDEVVLANGLLTLAHSQE